MKNRPFDHTDPDSIETYAKLLVGSSVEKQLGKLKIMERPKATNKGAVGQVVEHYFGIEKNNESRPDFPEAGVELKTSPLKKYQKGNLNIKEKLSLNMIDYHEMVHEKWSTSKFLSKNKHLLFVFYLWEKGRDPYLAGFDLANLWQFPESDLQRIKSDWELIHKKISSGKAHTISEGDTWYLAAGTKSTKSTNVPQPYSSRLAPKRALILKRKYIREIYAALKAGRTTFKPSELSSEKPVLEKILRFRGLTVDQISKRIKYFPKSKHRWGLIAKKAAGIGHADSVVLRRANIEIRAVRLTTKGNLHESFPFKTMSLGEQVEGVWEDSELYQLLTTRILFIVFEGDIPGQEKLKKAFFWTMPFEDVQKYGKAAWLRTRRAISNNNENDLPKEAEGGVVYVNTHGLNRNDRDSTAAGLDLAKRGFWISKAYLVPILRKEQ